jgi:hypothetical protein
MKGTKSFLRRGGANQWHSHENCLESLSRRYNLRWGNFKFVADPAVDSRYPTTPIILARMRRRSVPAFVIVTDSTRRTKKDFHISMKLQVRFALTQQSLLYNLESSSILYQWGLGLYCVTTTTGPLSSSSLKSGSSKGGVGGLPKWCAPIQTDCHKFDKKSRR